MNREGKKCVLYPRVSTEMQVDGYSLEGQKNGLRRFADREEMDIVGIYEDAGKSGKSIEGRPAFKKMLSDIKNGLEIDYILVYKLSRFGRNAADILNSLEFVQSYGINLICIEEGIDSSQTSGKLLISVLSAVAEIERENIIEQTMNGRREKARQGGWNGGFAPYGYYLKDNQLLIEETEAEAIRIIFEKFANSDIGLGGVAKYLNLQGIKKIPRQNGTLETWSSHFIRLILDNPVYCGKIAYGRRTREKVKGTKNEYKQVHAEDYILEDGQHEGIISEELWQKVHAKRMATGIKQPSKVGKDRSHLLTGILKCPLCGSAMYTNKHAWTNKDGTYKEVYYYICGRNKQERGHHCDYKASLRKTDIEPLVIEAVKELVSDKYFAKEIEKRIGVQTDTTAIDKELANYESKLKEVDLNKARLEREIDNLPVDTRFRERKIHDMTLRLDALYDTIVELEERIEDAKLRKSSIEMETITLDNIYKLMLNFGKLYDIISDEEKKSLITYLIKEIQIYPNGESEKPLKSIEFNFPIYRDGQEVRRLLWEKGNTVETDLDQTKESMYKLSYVVRVSADDLDELKRRCDEVKDFYDDLNVKLVRPAGDMLGLHSEFLPASKRYINDYVQYVKSDFLAGLGFGATQQLGETTGIYMGYSVDTGRNVYLQPSLASQGVKGTVTNALASAFVGSLGGGKSFCNNLLVYYSVLFGGQAVILDPKAERGNWKETLPEIAHEINIVNLTSDKDNAGLLDPFVIMKNVKDAESLAIDILTFLTGISSRDGEKFPVLRKAVRSVTQSDSRGLLHVIDELRREDTPISRNIADHIDSFTDYDFAHLLFSDGTVENAISLDNQLNIIQVADLVLPDKDTTFEEYTTIELLSVSMLIVISTFALDFIHSDRSIFKIVDLDEAWAFLNVAQGETLSNKLVRAGRAMQAGVYFVTQSSGDVSKESLKNNIGLKFAFRSTDINEIKQTLEFFGIDKDDENNQKRLRDLENGQCLLQDLYGRVGVVQIHPVFEELLHAFDTRPPVQRNEVE